MLLDDEPLNNAKHARLRACYCDAKVVPRGTSSFLLIFGILLHSTIMPCM